MLPRAAAPPRVSSLSVLVLLAASMAFAQTPLAPPAYRIAPFAVADQRAYSADQLAILEKLNRRDLSHLARLTEVIAPEVWHDDELDYSPLPRDWVAVAQFPKFIVVHEMSQVFGAYEGGHLVRWGPVSTGRVENQTPPGLFHLTWRARTRRSTDNNEWILNWYFNFINERGISFHEFELPGRPASHACVRLLTRDAKWIYGWGDQWQLTGDRRQVAVEGTPVLILGPYDFKRPAPWLSLDAWSREIVLPDSVTAALGQ